MHNLSSRLDPKNNLSKEILWYGSKDPVAEIKTLRAGVLEIDLVGGNLRNIRVGHAVVLQMIYFAVRDHNWGTIAPQIQNEVLNQTENTFQVRYSCLYEKQPIRFRFNVQINGNSSSEIVFIIEGESLSDFLANRVGFCVLHPIEECVGKSCTITSPRGVKSHAKFPKLISPNQPMKNMAAMSWQIDERLTADLRFEGEIFEMEDQRNWTGHSFKTCCRPLEQPFPFDVKKGEKVKQTIHLRVNQNQAAMQEQEATYIFSFDESHNVEIPKIGIGRNRHPQVLTSEEIELIKNASLDYHDVRVVFEDSWIAELRAASKEAVGIELKLAIRAVFSEKWSTEILQLEEILGGCACEVHSLLVFQKGELVAKDEFVYSMITSLREAFPGVIVGAGTEGSFAELNRNKIMSNAIDFLGYSIRPQVHAFDNLSLVENLAGQSDTVTPAEVFANGKDIHIRSVSLRMQTNPMTTSDDFDLTDHIDARQMSLLGTGWTLGSIKRLAESGASSITYYETLGEKGIIQGKQKSRY